jgi:type VI protein secretion system component Hcp
VLTLSFELEHGTMAIDAYLQIDGIKGESQESAHQGWIEINSAHFAQPHSRGKNKWLLPLQRSHQELKADTSFGKTRLMVR